MTAITLADYTCDRLYSFERPTGAAGAADCNKPASGFGQWRTFGLRKRTRAFVALFLDADSIVISIDGTEHPLTGPGVLARLERRSLGLARDFTLSRNGQVLLNRTYWFLSASAWPDDGDIFSLACRITAAKDGARGFVAVWRARSEGRDLTSKAFIDELRALAEQPPP